MILVLSLVSLQVVLALVHPLLLVNLSLFTGIWPMTFGREGMITTAFGRLDFSALRLLGFWVAAGLVILLQLDRAWSYLSRFRWHLFFLVFCGMALLWAPSPAYGARMLAKLSAPFLFLVLVLVVVSTRDQLKRMETLMLVTGGCMLALAGFSRTTGFGGPAVGLTIPFTTPALFSAFLVTISMLFLSRAKRSNRAANFLFFLSLTAGVIGAFTRITIAALFLSASVVLFYATRGFKRMILPTMGLIGLPALFLFSETFKNRMFYGTKGIDAQTLLADPGQILGHLHGSGRFSAWPLILEKFFYPSPAVGSGLGATQNFFYSQIGGGLGVIHSEYVRLLSEVGIFGLSLFLIATAAYLYRLRDTYRRSPQSDAGKYALAAIGGLVGYLIFMATDNAFDYVNGVGIYVFGLIAMSEKARELESRVEDASPITVSAPRPARRRYPIIEPKGATK